MVPARSTNATDSGSPRSSKSVAAREGPTGVGLGGERRSSPFASTGASAGVPWKLTRRRPSRSGRNQHPPQRVEAVPVRGLCDGRVPHAPESMVGARIDVQLHGNACKSEPARIGKVFLQK